MDQSLAPNQVAARLERLPVGRYHYRFLFWISLGGWFDMYDNFVAGPLMEALKEQQILPQTEPGEWFSLVGLFMAALPLGMFLGTMFFGLASDYLGRRLGFIAMLLLYSLATLAGGIGYHPLVSLLGTAAGLVLLLATRFLAGAGVGAENVVIDAYVSEIMPRKSRGWALAWTQALAFTAMPVAALLARLLTSGDFAYGWNLLLIFGSLGALFTWNFRRRLPESPRWLASVGRGREAGEQIEQIEKAIVSQTGQSLPSVDVAPQPSRRRLPFRAIWSPAYRKRTIMLMGFQVLQVVGYYGFTHWLVTLLTKRGFALEDALTMQFGAFFLAPVGPLLGVWSIERWQRKWTIVGLACVLAFLQISLGFLQDALALTLIAAVIVLGLNWFSAVFHAYQAELFPTEARATGIGFTYAWSRLSMVVLNLVMPGIIATHWGIAFGLMATAFCAVAVLIGLFGPLTNSLALEEISA
ncbi:MAG TPA: MFS transporter [Gemmataceae bacterium]|nr:MFS transporter [Gemmataceae bacterium]